MVRPRMEEAEVSKSLKWLLKRGELDWTSLVEEVTKDLLRWRGICVAEGLIDKVVKTARKNGNLRYEDRQRGSQRYVRLSVPNHLHGQQRETGRPLEQHEVDFYKFSVDMAKFLRQGTRPYQDLATVVKEFVHRGLERSHVEQLLRTQRHSDGRCRFERLLLDGREVLWATPNTKPFQEAEELGREMRKAMNNFDNKVSQRDGKQVLKEDSKEVEDLCAIIGSWLQSEACHVCRLHGFDKIDLDEVPGVMKRYPIFFDGDAIDIRIHYFKETSETTIHNHRMNFFSYCLKGGYDHEVWGVSTAQGQEHHYATNRSQDPSMESPMQKFAGRLKIMIAHSYGEGNCYFLDHEAPHTVRPRDGSALTIFVKSKCDSADTWVRSPDQTLPEHSRTKDTPIKGAEDKLAFLEEIWQLLQPASRPTRCATGPFPGPQLGQRWKRHGTQPAA